MEISRKIVKIGRKRRKVAEGGKKEWKGVVCGAKRMEKNRSGVEKEGKYGVVVEINRRWGNYGLIGVKYDGK